ncbi:nucleotidyltransferase domain-containing protein [Rugamonas sp. DEMB1]|uniref:nucleotidyltransferase domain-containing protein n=1 Tax=Rugamonas sp. DEMB1 TaxID=3039386 RepID=UPI00244C1B12|nr:nucleotidyltransferase domain-containing protein [Rugamonas sp. DEMB1]WGG52805.1 nucleotidyltransferase domain-containing protein [Rugamonas sp. DEMB1]
MKCIEAAKIRSQEKINELRKILENEDSTFTIVVGGSLARGEASDESDIDYFFFGDDKNSIEKATKFLNSKQDEISKIVGKSPSADGAFGSSAFETQAALITDIGGGNDTNEKITRRILFLLEGTWLSSESTFVKYRDAVLNRYVSEFIEPHHLCRFLLNDIIRYYRTICVDFEFKTVEKNKEWGLRYIKLRYSRQLLYFSGLIAVAETAGLPHQEKLKKLVELFGLSPIDRISSVCGEEAAKALELYDNFLSKISDADIRKSLNLVTLEKTSHTAEFVDLQKKGREFTLALSNILTETYSSHHLIHNALIF